MCHGEQLQMINLLNCKPNYQVQFIFKNSMLWVSSGYVALACWQNTKIVNSFVKGGFWVVLLTITLSQHGRPYIIFLDERLLTIVCVIQSINNNVSFVPLMLATAE